MSKNIIITVLIIISVISTAIAVYLIYSTQSLEKRQQEIRNQGPLVMPFDLTETKHILQQTYNGGIQQVRGEAFVI